MWKCFNLKKTQRTGSCLGLAKTVAWLLAALLWLADRRLVSFCDRCSVLAPFTRPGSHWVGWSWLGWDKSLGYKSSKLKLCWIIRYFQCNSPKQSLPSAPRPLSPLSQTTTQWFPHQWTMVSSSSYHCSIPALLLLLFSSSSYSPTHPSPDTPELSGHRFNPSLGHKA